jgi:hypothetical protein
MVDCNVCGGDGQGGAGGEDGVNVGGKHGRVFPQFGNEKNR